MFRQVITKEYVQSRDSWEHMSTYMIHWNIVIANINGRYRRSTDLCANCQAPVACAKLAPTDVMRLKENIDVPGSRICPSDHCGGVLTWQSRPVCAAREHHGRIFIAIFTDVFLYVVCVKNR